MDTKPTHIIQRQYYDVTVPTERYGMQLQQDLQQMGMNSIVPAISIKLDELFGSDNVVTINKLEIDIGQISPDAAPQDWVEKILAGLETSLRLTVLPGQGADAPQTTTITHTQHAINAWLYFLATGMLPAETMFKTVDELMQVIFLLTNDEKKILRNEILLHHAASVTIQRLALSNTTVLLFFVQVLMPAITTNGWQLLQQKISATIQRITNSKNLLFGERGIDLKNQTADEILQAIWEAAKQNSNLTGSETGRWLQNKIVTEILQRILQMAKQNIIITDNDLQKMANLKPEVFQVKEGFSYEITEGFDRLPIGKKKQDSSEENAAENEIPMPSFFVNNAGLCLLAPYLSMFFKAIELCNDKQFFTKAKQQHAIYLLHHLATGQMDAPEEQLVFAKLLCGWPLHMPCTNEQPITDQAAKESLELLVSVIGHWQALKNTSPAGLQQAFLQRTGKLIMEDGAYTLLIEQQTIDILLDSIPWTFRMLKLPWMKKMVKVDWF